MKANQISTERAERQYRLKIASLLGSVTHTQVRAEQALEQASLFMDDLDLEESDVIRTLENFSCVCDETLAVLFNEYRKGGLE